MQDFEKKRLNTLQPELSEQSGIKYSGRKLTLVLLHIDEIMMIVSKQIRNKQNSKEHFYVYEDASITKQIISLKNFEDMTKSTFCKNLIHCLTIIQGILLSHRMAPCTFP